MDFNSVAGMSRTNKGREEPSFFQKIRELLAKFTSSIKSRSLNKSIAIGVSIFLIFALAVSVYLVGRPTQLFPRAQEASSIANGLVAYWRFDETSGDAASDSKGVNNATAVNTTIVDGKSNKARQIGVSDSFISVPDTAVFGSDQVAVAGWIKPGSFGVGNFASIFNRRPTSNGSGMTLEYAGYSGSGNGQLQCQIFTTLNGSPSSVGMISSGNGVLITGQWNHVVCTYDGSTAGLYINGNLVASGTTSGSVTQGTGTQIKMGQNIVDGSVTANAILDEFAVWNRGLTAQEITALASGILPLPLPSPSPIIQSPTPVPSNFPGASIAPGISINVRDYGARGDGITDDTAAIQAAIAAANQSGVRGSLAWKEVYFPYGDYVVSSINATNRQSLRLRGETMLGTRLIPSKQTTSMPVIDASGSPYFAFENMSILGHNAETAAAFSVNPSVGVLLAINTYSTSTKVSLRRVYIVGFWEKAGVYIYGGTNNTFDDVSIHSYTNGVPSLVLTGSNSIGGTGNYVTSPYTTLSPAAPTQYTSDLTCLQCELHTLIFKRQPPYGDNRFDLVNLPRRNNTNTVIVENASNFKMFGGVISTDGPAEIDLRGKVANISLSGVVIESESGHPPQDTIYINGQVDGLILSNILLNNGMSPSGWLIHTSTSSTITSLAIQGAFSAELPQYGRLIKIEPHANLADVVLSNSLIQSHGWGMEIGGSIKSTIIIDPGNIDLLPGATSSAQLVR